MKTIDSWISAAKDGHGDALGVALESFRGYLLAVARGELEPGLIAKGGASDLVQETFLEAHKDFDRFEGKDADDLCVWLRGILMHRLANFRRHYRETRKRRVDREIALSMVESPEGWEPSERDRTPSREVERREQYNALREALARLPEKHRSVIVLRHEERLTFSQIGERSGISEDAARKRWGRAIELLRDALEESHEYR